MSSTNTLSRTVLVLLVLVMTAVVLSPVSSRAQTSQSQDNAMFSSKVELQMGYFFGRRGAFRDLYGSGLDFGAAFHHRMGSKWGWMVRTGFSRFGEDTPKLTYTQVSLAPMCTYHLMCTGSPQLFVGAGPGVSYRRVSFTFARTYPMDEILSYVDGKQDEYGMFVLLMAGLDIDLGGRTSFGGRVYFDRYFTGDPMVGDLGDTGGFHFLGVFGFGL